MPVDQPPNLVSSDISQVRYAQEQDKLRIQREQERKRAQDAEMRLRSQQTQKDNRN